MLIADRLINSSLKPYVHTFNMLVKFRLQDKLCPSSFVFAMPPKFDSVRCLLWLTSKTSNAKTAEGPFTMLLWLTPVCAGTILNSSLLCGDHVKAKSETHADLYTSSLRKMKTHAEVGNYCFWSYVEIAG